MKLAWRNIWRKKRRSVIVILSIVFAMVISISFRSLQWGSYEKMIEAGTKNVGYLQVQHSSYWEDKSINDLLEDSKSLRDSISRVEGVVSVIPRLQNYALAASDEHSKGALVIGIEPEVENQFNGLSKRLQAGTYLFSHQEAVLISEGLAKYLKLAVSDTLVLVSQGYRASIAAGKYPIKGILKLADPNMNLMTVYMPLAAAQAFNDAYGLLNSLMVDVEIQSRVKPVQEELRETLSNQYAIMRWDEMLPEIQQSINTDTTIATLLLTALYLIIGFGIIGTIIMMALERKREFGMLQAVGLQKYQIQVLITLEGLLLCGLGICIGWLAAYPIVLYMHYNPIPLQGEAAKSFEAMGVEPLMQFAVRPTLFTLMGTIIFCIMIFSSIWPISLVQKLKMNEAIKS